MDDGECPLARRETEMRISEPIRKKENEPERIIEREGILQREKKDIQECGEVVMRAVRQS